jgi:adenylate cyclase class IV
MIEVEKKFILEGEDEKRLIDKAEFIGEKVFTDIYYDTNDFSLTIKDKWLRSREGRFELKLTLHQGGERKAGQYEEIENEEKIRNILNIPVEKDMEDDLEKNGYLKFCICKTTRKKYKKEFFNIDIDFVNFEDFNYELAEIELMIENKSDIDGAIEKIINFAKEKGLKTSLVRGKVIEYLKRKKPEHYQALVNSGTVKDF